MLEHPLWRGDPCDRNDTLRSSSSPLDDGPNTTSSWSSSSVPAFERRHQPVINKSNKYQHKWWCRRKRRRLRRLSFAKCRQANRRQLRITGTVCGGRGQLQYNMYLINKEQLLANGDGEPLTRSKRAATATCLPVGSTSAAQSVVSGREELYHTYKLDIKSDKLTRETSTPINVSSKSSSTKTLSSLSKRTAAPTTTTTTTPIWLSTIYSSKIFTPVLLLNILLQSWLLPTTRKTARSAKSLTPTARTLTNVVVNLLLITLMTAPAPTTLALFVDSSVSIVAAPHGGPNAASLALTGSDNSPPSGSNGESSLGNLFMEKPGGSKAGGGSSSSFNLESKLAAVFRKAAYGTTTKRSIPDSVFVPSLTTVPTPLLTTFR
jgi:hypothetical protein